MLIAVDCQGIPLEISSEILYIMNTSTVRDN